MQIFTLYLQSLLLIIYIIYYKPFISRLLNMLEIFNEVCILLSSYHLLMFTDFNIDENSENKAGYSLIAITALNVLVNTVFMAIQTYYKIKQAIRKILRVIRLKMSQNK